MVLGLTARLGGPSLPLSWVWSGPVQHSESDVVLR